MKICYLIQAYADSNAFKRLVSLLLENQNSYVLVHLDKKSNINEFKIENDRVMFIKNRELVSWGGYNQGKLILNLIDEAVKLKDRFDRYCFLSESDYPVYKGEKLIKSIIRTHNIMLNCSKYQKNKVEKYWFYDFNIKSPKVNKLLSHSANFISELLYRSRILKKENQVLIDGQQVDVFFSGPFWQYTFEEIEYINDVFKRNKSIERYFKHAFAPCELIVSTIIANSPFAEKIIFADKYINLNQLSGLCFFKYTGSRVDVLDENDYYDIIKSQKPFIRKVNINKSERLLDLLKE